ncbi:Ku protein [Falsiroseomonas bella]|uniref:Non-homologous end joining protein Ku n=1 Tax=Falsiroseomonas bella TaxID=2184016 RepID=A0A317FJC1_9PROT|nr:Ku protein [Falsiroseomonas bella]PWS39151.1 Ku protein [Falsiroseomonas bella]
MPARPVWEGHLRLSLVTCGVALHKAVGESGGDVRFHLLNPETHNRVRQCWRDAGTGDEVSRRELVRGFEVAKDEYVVVTDEDIQELKLESTKVVDIERFVDCDDIDRLYWDQPYYMVPSGRTAAEPFAVIREAMRGEKRVAIGRIVMANRERVVAIEVRGPGLLLSTLRSQEEVRSDAVLFEDIPEAKLQPQMIDIAKSIIAQQAGPFAPEDFTDRYQEALAELVQRKTGGSKPTRKREAPEESNVIDLMEALKRSLKGGGKGAEKQAEKPAAKKAPAKQTGKKAPAPAAKTRRSA